MPPASIKGNGGVSQSHRLLPARSHVRAAGRAGRHGAAAGRPAPAHLPKMSRAVLRVSLLLLAALGRAGAGSEQDQDQEHGDEDSPHPRQKGEQGVPRAWNVPDACGTHAGFGMPCARGTLMHGTTRCWVWGPWCLGTPMQDVPQLRVWGPC